MHDSHALTYYLQRIVIRKKSGDGNVGLTAMGTDCSGVVTQPTDFGSTACVSVGANQNRKYYKVYTTGAADFTASVGMWQTLG